MGSPSIWYSHLFRHVGKLYDRLSVHFAHDLGAMHFDGGFTAYR
jgi:hypothetical protein